MLHTASNWVRWIFPVSFSMKSDRFKRSITVPYLRKVESDSAIFHPAVDRFMAPECRGVDGIYCWALGKQRLSSNLRNRAAHDAPPATPPTIITFILYKFMVFEF
jgi:hypothetical protein